MAKATLSVDDFLAEVRIEIENGKAVVREMHSLMKEARQLSKEMKNFQKEVELTIQNGAEPLLAELVSQVGRDISIAQQKHYKKIIDEFDAMAKPMVKVFKEIQDRQAEIQAELSLHGH